MTRPTPARPSTIRLVPAAALALLLAGTALLQPARADDDRHPTAGERARIEASLQAGGYVSWEEIEMDDGLWEVDDARKEGAAGEWDVKLDPQSYAIVAEERDD